MNLATIRPGDTFGNLTVRRESHGGSDHGKRFRVKCACGRRLFVKQSKLRNGEATDCGRCAEESKCKDGS